MTNLWIFALCFVLLICIIDGTNAASPEGWFQEAYTWIENAFFTARDFVRSIWDRFF